MSTQITLFERHRPLRFDASIFHANGCHIATLRMATSDHDHITIHFDSADALAEFCQTHNIPLTDDRQPAVACAPATA